MRIAVVAPRGRMGREVVRLLEQAGTELSIVDDKIEEKLLDCASYIDFSSTELTEKVAKAATALQIPGIVGTTALSPGAKTSLEVLAKVAPVICAANFSLGVNLLLALASKAAEALGPDFDKEVFEIHHKNKKDAPSGTALALAEAINAGNTQAVVTKRNSSDLARQSNEIGVAAARGGDVIGEHTVFFFGQEERIELVHRATDRAVFAAGAIRAARWIAGKSPGWYSMNDVLGL